MLAIKESVMDMSPYVRKTSAHAIPKLYWWAVLLIYTKLGDSLVWIVSNRRYLLFRLRDVLTIEVVEDKWPIQHVDFLLFFLNSIFWCWIRDDNRVNLQLSGYFKIRLWCIYLRIKDVRVCFLNSLDPEQKDMLIEVIEKLLADKTTVSLIDMSWWNRSKTVGCCTLILVLPSTVAVVLPHYLILYGLSRSDEHCSHGLNFSGTLSDMKFIHYLAYMSLQW